MSYYEDEVKIRNQVATRIKEETDEEMKLVVKFAKTLKYLKIVLAFLLVGAYFYKPHYLTELLAIGLFISLLLPQGFVDTYLEKLINLRAAETDERQILNANETNEHFSFVFDRIDKLERRKRDA